MATDRADLVALARSSWDALARRDLGGFLANIDENVQFHSLIAEVENPVYHGHDGVRQWWDSLDGSVGGLSFEALGFEADGDCVITKLRARGRVGEHTIEQTMWQCAHAPAGKVVWWKAFRSEAEAREAAAGFSAD